MLISGTILQSRYQIIRQLGVGGMGTVYQAYDLRLGNRQVVVKENRDGDPVQFQTEANILASLNHPHLPRVFDHFVEPSGAQYLVMDYIQGQDLGTLLEGGALREQDAIAWLTQVMSAVEHLHANRIIHRDIKPQNIILTPQRQAVLVDFGIAKRLIVGSRTQSGARATSPGFSAPEQYGGGTDQRSDIYSLGATLYALLTASAPPDALWLLNRTAKLKPPRAVNPYITPSTEQAIMRTMALSPQYRPQTVSEFRSTLLQNLTTPPTVPVTAPSAPTQPPLRQSFTLPSVPRMQARADHSIPAWLLVLSGGVMLLLVLGLGGQSLFTQPNQPTPVSSTAVALTVAPSRSSVSAPTWRARDFALNQPCDSEPATLLVRLAIDAQETVAQLRFTNQRANDVEVLIYPPGDPRAFYIATLDKAQRFPLKGASGVAVYPASPNVVSPGSTIDLTLRFERIPDSVHEIQMNEGTITEPNITYWYFYHIRLD